MDDLIRRQDAVEAMMDLFKRVPTNAIRAKDRLEELPSAQPDSSACWGCNCPKMEQKTFSEMVRLHDAERRTDEAD